MTSRWNDDPHVARGDDYQQRFERLAASGAHVHGEADLVDSLLGGASSVLDAGCGTGRVGIELAARGHAVEGVDLDPAMLAVARREAPQIPWHDGDLTTFSLDRLFDAVVLAGNVLIFVRPGTEGAAVARCAACLAPGGVLIAGFQVRPGGYGPERLDADAAGVGLGLRHRWATWDRRPWVDGGDYQVSVHALA